MAKGHPVKRKRPSAGNKGNLSTKSYAKLVKEARNARRRIADFSKRPDAGNYIVPSVADYRLDALINRIEGGESVRSVLKDVRNVTADNIRKGKGAVAVSANGYKLSTQEAGKLKRAMDEANRNIRAARKKFTDFKDVMPPEFSYKELVFNIVNAETVNNRINDLGLFTPDKLLPTAINKLGEAGTEAESTYYRRILERENQRRLSNQSKNDPRKNKNGYFLQQDDYDSQPIDIDAIKDFETLKQRAITWDDPARIYRANLFLDNYLNSLETFESILVTNGQFSDEEQEKFDKIREIIGKLYFNEEAITYLTKNMPQLSITVISPPKDKSGNVIGGSLVLDDLDPIYLDWIQIKAKYHIK